MGLFSTIKGVAKITSKIVSGLDAVSNGEEYINDLLSKKEKLENMFCQAVDVLDKKCKNMIEKEEHAKMVQAGIENEERIKVDNEKLYNITYSIRPKYEKIIPIEEKLFIAKEKGKYGIIDIEDKIIVPFEYDYIKKPLDKTDLIAVSKNGCYGFINLRNEIIVDFKFVEADYFSCGLAPVYTEYNKCGYIDSKGNFVIEPIYRYVEPFLDNGLAKVSIMNNNNCDWLYGVINSEGKVIVEPQYSNVSIYKNHIKCAKYDYVTNFDSENCYDFNGVPVEDFEDFCAEKSVELWWTRLPLENLYIYKNSKLKYGWYERTEDGDFCRIPPIYDGFEYIRYTQDGTCYSVVKYGQLYGIVKVEGIHKGGVIKNENENLYRYL